MVNQEEILSRLLGMDTNILIVTFNHASLR